MEYKTKGVCSMAIQYDIDDEQKVHNVKFQTVTLTHQFCPIYHIKIGHPLKTSPDLCLHSPRFCV